MDLVLGLGMTSRAVRWVLVEGTTGEGNPVDRGAITIGDVETYDPEGLLRGLVDDPIATGADRIHAIGVTWTSDAAPLAGTILETLEAHGHADVVAVSEVEATGLLASGIAEIGHLDNVAVCIIESDAAVAATVTPDAVSVDRIDRAPDDPGAAQLIDSIKAVLEESTHGRTDAIFLLGSECDETIVSALDGLATVPVISAAEADLAFPRGAALAAALAVNTQYGQAASGRRGLHLTKVGALTSVLVAASVTLVVATTAAIGIRLHPGAVAPAPEVAHVSERSPAASPPAPKAVPKPRPAAPPPAPKPAAPPPAPAAPPVPAAPPAPAAPPVVEAATEPVYDPPAYVPPAAPPPAPEPVYVPPPPPAYVPAPPPPPRLRDRILERIPIIGRFHEPRPW